MKSNKINNSAGKAKVVGDKSPQASSKVKVSEGLRKSTVSSGSSKAISGLNKEQRIRLSAEQDVMDRQQISQMVTNQVQSIKRGQASEQHKPSQFGVGQKRVPLLKEDKKLMAAKGQEKSTAERGIAVSRDRDARNTRGNPEKQVSFNEMNDMQQIQYIMQKRESFRNQQSQKYGAQGTKRQFQRRSKFFRNSVKNQKKFLESAQADQTELQSRGVDSQLRPKKEPKPFKRIFSIEPEDDPDVQQSTTLAGQQAVLNPSQTNEIRFVKEQDQPATAQDPRKLTAAPPHLPGKDQSTNQRRDSSFRYAPAHGENRYQQNRLQFHKQKSQFVNKIGSVNDMDVDSSDYCSQSQSEGLASSHRSQTKNVQKKEADQTRNDGAAKQSRLQEARKFVEVSTNAQPAQGDQIVPSPISSALPSGRDENKISSGVVTDASEAREASSRFGGSVYMAQTYSHPAWSSHQAAKKPRDPRRWQRSHAQNPDSLSSSIVNLTGSGSEGLASEVHIANFTHTAGQVGQAPVFQSDLQMNQLAFQSSPLGAQLQVPLPNQAQQTPPMLSRSTSSNQSALRITDNEQSMENRAFQPFSGVHGMDIISERDEQSSQSISQKESQQKQQQNRYQIRTGQGQRPTQSKSVYMQQLSQKSKQANNHKMKSQFSKKFDDDEEMSDQESISGKSDEENDKQRPSAEASNAAFQLKNKIENISPVYNNWVQGQQDELMESDDGNDDDALPQPRNFERFAGNIAESDDDYDEEDQMKSSAPDIGNSNQSQVRDRMQSDGSRHGKPNSLQQHQDETDRNTKQKSYQDEVSHQKIVTDFPQKKYSSNTLNTVTHQFINDNTARSFGLDSTYKLVPQGQMINIIAPQDLLRENKGDICIIHDELSQQLEPQLVPIKRDESNNRRVSQFSPFGMVNRNEANNNQSRRGSFSYNDAGSSVSSEGQIQSSFTATRNAGIDPEDEDHFDEDEEEEEYNFADEVDDLGQNSLPQSLATTINNKSIQNLMNPSRLIGQNYNKSEQKKRFDNQNEQIDQAQNQVISLNDIPPNLGHGCQRQSSFQNIQINSIFGQRDVQASNTHRILDRQIQQRQQVRNQQNQAVNSNFDSQRQNSDQSNHSRNHLNYQTLQSNMKSQISQNAQADANSNFSHSKQNSNSNEEQNRGESRTNQGTGGESNSVSNGGANGCGVSLSSLKEQIRKDNQIISSPKALTTKSFLSQSKNTVQKYKNQPSQKSSANAKTLNEKVQILHKQSQSMTFQTNLAQISTQQQATKGSPMVSEEKVYMSTSHPKFAQKNASQTFSEINEVGGLSYRKNYNQQSDCKPRKNQSMKFTEKVDQKVIDDNFNYQTEINNTLLNSKEIGDQEIVRNIYADLDRLQQKKKDIVKQKQEDLHRNENDDESMEVAPDVKQNHQQQQSHVEQKKKGVDIVVSDDVEAYDTIDVNWGLLQDKQVPFFPDHINKTQDFNDDFMKQFQEVISKHLKKKLKPHDDLSGIQRKLAPSQRNQRMIQFRNQSNQIVQVHKKTVVLTIDDCILKTSIFKDDFPNVDCFFKFQKLKLYVCFRKHLKEFLHELQKYYEVIAWSSSQLEYSQELIRVIEEQLDFKFDYALTIAEQTVSEDKQLYVKNIEILCGEAGRHERNIIVVDSQLSNYTNRMTNGLYLPPCRLCPSFDDDDNLLMLLKYLTSFVVQTPEQDIRNIIKRDFDLLNRFNNNKQSLAFHKILKRTVEESGPNTQNIGVSGQRDSLTNVAPQPVPSVDLPFRRKQKTESRFKK